MICMEEVGMKRVLFNIVIPLSVMVLWMITCYPVCNKVEGFDYFLYWIMVGCPYGIRKMCMFLIPRNFGIAGSMGVLALNCIVGGLIGGIVLIIKEQNEIFNTSAVCSTLVLREELTENQGGTDAGGSNTENNRPCD